MGALQPEPGSALHTLFALVFPSVGVLLSAAFSLSPLPRLVRINKEHDLRGYDPLPPVLNLGSGVSWVLYSVMTTNPFTYTSGAVACTSSSYALLVSHAAAAPKARREVEHLTMGLIGVFLATSLAVMILNRHYPEGALAAVGLIANVLVLAVYVSPLKNLALVVRTRDSSSIYLPWSLLQFLNLLLWTIYGLCVMDVWILASSAFGLGAAIAALLLKAIYPHPPLHGSSTAAASTAAAAEPSALPIDSAASSLNSAEQQQRAFIAPSVQQQQQRPAHKSMAVSPDEEEDEEEEEGEEEAGPRQGARSRGASLVHGA